MSRSSRRSISSFFLLACGALALGAQPSISRYTQTRGATAATLEYRLAAGEDSFTLSASTPVSQESIMWRVGTGTADWSLVNDSDHTELHGTRTGTTIQVTGTLKGRAVSKVLKVDTAPWYQLFGPLLDQLLPAGTSVQEFWVLDPVDLSVHRMQVKRAGTEQLTLHGHTVPAQKVHFSPAGALAPFWGADFWYRQSDGLYVSSRLPEKGGVTMMTLEDPAP
ncbi:MAG TPA: hypothetical protein VFI08_07315 [Spirochaetia bacterium]|nr:hypothetical protein [Spirochaetia bacterium]